MALGRRCAAQRLRAGVALKKDTMSLDDLDEAHDAGVEQRCSSERIWPCKGTKNLDLRRREVLAHGVASRSVGAGS